MENEINFTQYYQLTDEVVTITKKQLVDKFGEHDFSKEKIIRYDEFHNENEILYLIGESKTVTEAFDYHIARK